MTPNDRWRFVGFAIVHKYSMFTWHEFPAAKRRGVMRILDKTNGQKIADLAGEKNPNSAAYDPVTKLTFVMNKNSGTATMVDAAEGKVVGTIPVSANTLEFPVADGRGRIYDNIETTGEIAVIDTRERKVVNRFKLNGCEGPSGLAYAATSDLLISACDNGIAKIIKVEDGTEVATVPIGRGPDAVIYDPRCKIAFVPCGGDGVLDVIAMSDPAKIALVQRLKTEPGSRTGTIDTRTGRLYLMASKPDMEHVQPNGRPARLPGSWEVLVVGR
jgi:DNA-binding beta-propeller fold protein YncE